MSETERVYYRYVDEVILRASPEELAWIQELDRKTQFSGRSFYDLFASEGRTISQTSAGSE